MTDSQTNTIQEYYLIEDGARKGPFTIHQLRTMWNAGSINLKTQYWQEGFADVRPLSTILNELEPPAPAAAPVTSQSLPASPTPTPPSKAAAEETVWEGHPSHWHFFWAWVIGILLLAGFGVLWGFVPTHPPELSYLFLSGLVAGILVILGIYIARANRVYTITNRKVVFQSGLFVKSSNEIRIRDIRSINVAKHGVSGFLGIGRIEFSSAATDQAEIVFSGVPNADKVRDIVRKLQDEV